MTQSCQEREGQREWVEFGPALEIVSVTERISKDTKLEQVQKERVNSPIGLSFFLSGS